MPYETRSTCTFVLLLIGLAFLLASGELRGEPPGLPDLKGRQDHVLHIHEGVRPSSRAAHANNALDEKKVTVSAPGALERAGDPGIGADVTR